MATQILRTVDRWRFEAPLALVLAAATGFAALAMPRDIFGNLPVVGRTGTPGHVALALLLAIVCGIAGYVAMRRPAKAVPIDEDAEQIDEMDVPSGLSEDRLHRLRRADRHPDAPPRAPIRASRDLGEPFMEIGTFALTPPAEHEMAPVETVSAEGASAKADILDGEYVEVEAPFEPSVETVVAAEPIAEEPVIEPIADEPIAQPEHLGEPVQEQPVAASPVDEVPVAAPIVTTVAPSAFSSTPRQDASIAAMMERLSAGMERRAGRPAAPARDMRPALRDALDELNRLAARRG